MKELASQLIVGLKPYFDSLLRKDPHSGSYYLYDDELGDRASCCTTGLAASLYLLDGKLNNSNESKEIVCQLAEEIRRRQMPSGAFGQPFYILEGEDDIADIAEIGAVANSLYYISKMLGSEAAKESLLVSAQYLLTQVSDRNPAVIWKRQGESFDVLNGDMYAALAFGKAYELSNREIYAEKVNQIFEHLANRFGKNTPGWWPYIEDLDGKVIMGNSVAYQGTIVSLANYITPILDEDLKKRWEKISADAIQTIIEAIKHSPTDETEAPWWARDWDNSWELHTALLKTGVTADIQQKGKSRFEEVVSDLQRAGAELFKPQIKNDVPNRSPVTTTFRRAAGFAGIASNIILEEIKLKNQMR